MLKVLLLLLLSTVLLGAQPLYPDLGGAELLEAVQADYTPSQVLNYRQARDLMYTQLDNENDSVSCIYTGHRLYLPPGANASQALYIDGSPDGINCEHVWPRSKGAREGRAMSDMHHLFPSRVAVNAARSNSPFAEIPDEQTARWYYRDQELNSIPANHIDAYSEYLSDRFEPREDKKGDIARAMLYFYTIYRAEALVADPLFFQRQRATLLAWNQQDPPDDVEQSRSEAIALYQDGKPNPFILDPTLAERLYGELSD